VSDCIAACEQALHLGNDPEVQDLAARMRAETPRELPAEAA